MVLVSTSLPGKHKFFVNIAEGFKKTDTPIEYVEVCHMTPARQTLKLETRCFQGRYLMMKVVFAYI